MTRASRSARPPSLAARFGRDPAGVILGVLEQSQTPLGKREIGARLAEGGVASAAFERAWRTAQERVRFDDHVIYERQRYRWTEHPREIPLEERIFRLTRNPDASTSHKLVALVREAMQEAATSPAELAQAQARAADAEARIADLQRRIDELAANADSSRLAPRRAEPEPEVRSASSANSSDAAVDSSTKPPAVPTAQSEPAHTEPGDQDEAHAHFERAERRRLARERQARIEAMSTVAELAAEVEELTAKQATPEVLLEHTRALTSGRGLEAIGTAGQVVPFDEEQHEPVGTWPDPSEDVTVIRPGYLWHAPGEAVLISRALVTRAKGTP